VKHITLYDNAEIGSMPKEFMDNIVQRSYRPVRSVTLRLIWKALSN